MKWTTDRQFLLADLSAQGYSAAEIAARIGETKNAVANTMTRYGLYAGLLLAASATGLWADVGNNWQYGLTVSNEAAIVLAAAAVGVAGFPALAGIRGWNGVLACCWAVCFTLTVGAAFLAYTGKQGQVADQREATVRWLPQGEARRQGGLQGRGVPAAAAACY